jgi:NADP-dependent isocitrate dehydrogenase
MLPRAGLSLLRAGSPAAARRAAPAAALATMPRIPVAAPVVELDGDEMARIMWHKVRDGLVLPHVDVALRYFDLSFENRDATDDQVTVEAAHAILESNVGIKAATITGTPQRLEEFGFSKLFRSPNGTIRNMCVFLLLSFSLCPCVRHTQLAERIL